MSLRIWASWVFINLFLWVSTRHCVRDCGYKTYEILKSLCSSSRKHNKQTTNITKDCDTCFRENQYWLIYSNLGGPILHEGIKEGIFREMNSKPKPEDWELSQPQEKKKTKQESNILTRRKYKGKAVESCQLYSGNKRETGTVTA